MECQFCSSEFEPATHNSKYCKTECKRSAENDRRRQLKIAKSATAGMKILLIDIETAPNLAYVWGLWDQNVGLNQIVSSTEMICFAAKWLHDKAEPSFYSLHRDGAKKMIEAAWGLLDEADVVMHYNGKAFDMPHLNREFLTAGLMPPAPYQQIDLYRAVKSKFKFPSNKLQYIAQALGLGGKVEHEGFGLWVKCMAGDNFAWKQMEKYNKQDVVLLEDIYNALQCWIPSHPSHGAMSGRDVCPSCGGTNLQPRGYSYTAVSKFQRYCCADCSRWSRSVSRDSGTAVREIAL